MARRDRCPLHPDGCKREHRNPLRGRPGPSGSPAKRQRPAPELRGSFARYRLHLQHNGARLLVDLRSGVERWIRGARHSAYPEVSDG